MVPMGMDFWASARSPDRLDPAMIPVTDGKNMPMRIVKVVEISANTWLYVLPICSMSFGSFPTEMYWPSSRKLSRTLSRN